MHWHLPSESCVATGAKAQWEQREGAMNLGVNSRLESLEKRKEGEAFQQGGKRARHDERRADK